VSKRRLLRLAAAGVGTTAALATAGVVVERRVVRARRSGAAEADRLGGVHSDPVPVTTEDGIVLHAEVDEVAPYETGSAAPASGPRQGQGAAATSATQRATLVFVHGYALNLDCWHFQRLHFRGKRRMVFYDQRSHGRSQRSGREHATIDQLGRDLGRVVDELVPEGPVVLVGHSMGGMSLMALADQRPELFGDRVVGAALISTSAGELRPHKMVSRLIPDRLGSTVGQRAIAVLARAPELVDSARRRGSNLGFLMTDRFAFGQEVPASYVELVDEMLAGTPFEVLAEFFPHFETLDRFDVLHAFGKVPTVIITGGKDQLTSVEHSRKMSERIEGARLVEATNAGHMVILERADMVNDTLTGLVEAAERHAVATRAS
jgi:pimeloyl-ACP methyl ester carboxylesterase